MRWWGWGDEPTRAAARQRRTTLLREELGSEPGDASRAVALEDVRLAGPALPARPREALARRSARDGVRDDHAARVAARRRAAATRTWCVCARARRLSAPDAVALPGLARSRSQAVLEACARERVAVVPFGGGTSVVGGVEPLREGFAGGRRRSTCARLDRLLDVDRGLADRDRSRAGMLGPEARGGAGRAGADARPLPAVVRVLDRRRLGGHPLGRAGVHGLRAHRRAGGGRCGCVSPAGELATRAVPASAAGPTLARAGGGLGGGARGDRRGDAARAPGARARAATRAGRSARSPRARRRSG